MYKRIVIWLLTIVVLLTGCTNAKSVNLEDNLKVGMDKLVTSIEGESITLTGYLENLSKHNFEIEFGADLFTYDIFDSEGNKVESPFSMFFG